MTIYHRDRKSWKQFISNSFNKKNDSDESQQKDTAPKKATNTHLSGDSQSITMQNYTVKRMSHDSSVYHPYSGPKKQNQLTQSQQKQRESLNIFTSPFALKRYIQNHISGLVTENKSDIYELIQLIFSNGKNHALKCNRISQAGIHYQLPMALHIHRNAILKLNETDIFETLRIPDFQEERRYYISQACKHFINDLYEESKENLALAESYEKYDPFVLYTSALINLYVPEHLDIEEGINLFLKSAKYFEAENKPERAAEAYFHASMGAYALKKDNDAIHYAEEAHAASPDFDEAAYALARFKASIGDKSALTFIKNLIEKNPLYGLKVHIDDAFLNLSDNLCQLMTTMRNTAKSECDHIHLAMVADRHLEKYQQRSPEDFGQWKSLFNAANQIYQKNSYMDYLDACPILQESDTFYQSMKLGQTSKKKRSQPINQYEKQQHQFVSLAKIQTRRDTDIAEKEIFDLLNETKALVHHNTDFQYLTRVTQAQASEKIAYLLDNPIACIDLATLSAHDSSVLSIAFSPCSQRLASGAEDGSIRIWSLKNYQCIGVANTHKKAVNCIRFSPDGHTLASASWDHSIKLWDANSLDEIGTLTGHTDSVEIIDFTMDGLILASGSNDQTVRLWDIPKMEHIHTFDNFSDTIRCLCFSPDGLQLTAGSWDIIHLWDVTSQKLIHSFKGQTKNYISALAISPDGLTLAAGSHDKTVRLWDLTSKKQSLKLQGHSRRINCVAFSPDNITLASGSHDRQVKLWNVKTGQEINGLDVHKDFVSAVSFSPDGMTLASGSHDAHIRLWQIHYKIMPKDALDETIERNTVDAQRRRQAQWRADLRCEVCGTRLGFIDMLKGRVRCSKHEKAN